MLSQTLLTSNPTKNIMGLASKIKNATPAAASQTPAAPPAMSNGPFVAPMNTQGAATAGNPFTSGPGVDAAFLDYPPPGAYAQPTVPAAVPATATLPSLADVPMRAIEDRLRRIVRENQLDAFYPPAQFQAVLDKVRQINFQYIAQQWNISAELAYELAPLALYDIVFYCDDSGSMIFEENGSRVDDLKFILSKVAGIATLFDDDGVVVRFINSNPNGGDGIRDGADVESLVAKVPFRGSTPLGEKLDAKVIQPLVLDQAYRGTMAKPVLVLTITDGVPTDTFPQYQIANIVVQAKNALRNTRYGPGALAIQIAQVGKDQNTQKFLATLDNHPTIGNMMDCTSYFELEEEEFAKKGVELTPEMWLLKMCVGAIDSEYDEKD